MTDMTDGTETVEAPPLEDQARTMGWVPQEEFKGDTGKWVDAKTFVDKGEHVLPIVKATNKRLRDDLTKTSTQVNELQAALQASQETIKALEDYHNEDVKQKVERVRKELRTQIIEAKRAGDVEAEVDLTAEMGKLDKADLASGTEEKKGNGAEKRQAPPPDYTKNPEFISWQENNAWFGTDKARTAIAQSIAFEMRQTGNREIGRPFLDKVAEETNREIAKLSGGRAATSKVEGSKGGAGGSNGGSRTKGFSDLPADAQAACDGFASRLVGKGKRHETLDAWRKSYVEQYNRDV
jgi:hypothetical protein